MPVASCISATVEDSCEWNCELYNVSKFYLANLVVEQQENDHLISRHREFVSLSLEHRLDVSSALMKESERCKWGGGKLKPCLFAKSSDGHCGLRDNIS